METFNCVYFAMSTVRAGLAAMGAKGIHQEMGPPPPWLCSRAAAPAKFANKIMLIMLDPFENISLTYIKST